ncbi:hypothetical protein BDD12DRAFT_823306 [Trichophaea hybrida]|nr:hypothetical protein BDD12DRAFT_823306 [Trichophaea hybrida]
MDLHIGYDETCSQKLSENSQYWSQLFAHAYLYRNNPEDVACRDFAFHDVPAFDIPFTPAENISSQQQTGSPRLPTSSSPAYVPPPDILYAIGNVEWRIVSNSPGPTNTSGYSSIHMFLGISSAAIEEAKLGNDFPASIPSISITSPTDETIRHCASLGISSETIQRARAALDNSKDNHLAVLTIAWTYILSALWGESQGGTSQYLDVAPENPCEDDQIVYIPGEESGAVNWWRQLLAQPSGWKVTMEYRGTAYHSPWNIRIPGDEVKFRVLSKTPPIARLLEPPDAATALKYLAQYCAFHGLTMQAETALAAALVLPTHLSAGIQVQVNLPKPVHAIDIFAVGSRGDSQQPNPELPLLRLLPQLPHLMTISACGIKNLLLGAFYNPNVPSTLCGEWFQPAVRAWPQSLAHASAIGCLRSPCLSRWWIGAGVTSFIVPRLIRLECCMWYTNLHLALWTGSARLSPHSHLCRVLAEEGITLHTTTEADIRLVLRADEILAAFLSSATGPQKMFLSFPPAPFHPPGYAELDKSSLQIIRAASSGIALRLEFMNCAWKTRGDTGKKPMSYPVTEPTIPSPGILLEWEIPAIESLIGSAQNASENVTRSIMDWICGYRGIEADQDRGDLDLEELFAVYDDDD